MSEGFIGEIRMFAGNFAPRSWAFCHGQLLPIAQNTALFSILGTTYGGDGRTSFALPDLRGRVPLAPGTGPGLTDRRLGERGGTEQHVLTEAEMPRHVHGAADDQTTNRADGGVPARGGAYGAPSSAGPPAGLRGSGVAHNNMQPYLGMNYIICLQGIFPSRN